MDKLALAPRLPKDIEELRVRGFEQCNISKAAEWITDGHSMFKRQDADAIIAPARYNKKTQWREPVEPGEILKLWKDVESNNHIEAGFIGCAVVIDRSIEKKGEKKPVAVLRDSRGRHIVIDPYKLGFLISVVKAETIKCAHDLPSVVALYRGEDMVAAVMPMRYDSEDLAAYNLSGPWISLSEAMTAEPVKEKAK